MAIINSGSSIILNETWPWTGTGSGTWNTVRVPVIQDKVWYSWHTTNTTTAATTVNYDIREYTWQQWNLTQHYQDEVWRVRPYVPPVPSQAELDRRQRQREEDSRRRLARAARVEGAHDKALELLELVLSAEERLWRTLHQEVMVRGSDGGMYVVEERGVHGNIRQVDEHGCVLARLCVAPQMYEVHPELGHIGMPEPDGWVGQILSLKFNEAHLREKANFSYLRGCQQPDVPILERAA